MATIKFPVRPLQPGSYSVINANGVGNNTPLPNAPVVGLVGDAKGGAPNTALRFRNPTAAVQTLRSGALLDCVRASFMGGASIVFGVRAGAGAAQGTTALAGASGTPINLTALDYGAWTNSIRRTIAADNKVTVTYTDPDTGTTYTETWAPGAAATAQQVVDAVNGVTPGFSASRFIKGVNNGAGTMPLNTSASAALTGGADASALDGAAWTVGLTVLETQQVDLVGVATGDASVHAQVRAHCLAMSDVQARRERVTVVGGPLAETVANQVTRAGNLGLRSELVYPGIRFPNMQGVDTLWAPYVAAAFTLGQYAALPDQATSLLHRVLPNVTDVEVPLSTIPGGDLDTLLAAHVTPIAAADGDLGVWYVDALTANPPNQVFRDFHKIRTADEVAKRLRFGLEVKFVGGKTLNGTAQDVANEATGLMTRMFNEQLIRDFDPITVEEDETDATTLLVSAPVVLPDTTKRILIVVALRNPLPQIVAAETVV